MKIGLVMEGGAMRGMYTAGVTDVLMENDIVFDGGVGVSAGAAFGCNYKSHQIGRTIRYNKKYCTDKRYVSVSSWLKTGNLYGEEFAYSILPKELDVFDNETFKNNKMEFYVVCTDMATGKPVYHKCYDGGDDDLKWLQASAALPLAFKPVNIDGVMLADGGMADSIPLKFMQGLGYEKNVVIMTRHKGYEKKKNSLLPVLKVVLRKYPNMLKAIENRHIMYNNTLKYIEEQEKEGKVFVFYPSREIEVGVMEKDANRLEEVYQLGRKDANNLLEKLKEFMKQ
ncbi:MAG: patatin family protein [Clostridia bacterium]|nr:patatin family protein [Clostridia bacterium]